MKNELETALSARKMGIVAIPFHPGTKIPMVRWKVWQTMMPPLELQTQWFSEPCNVGIITTEMIVFDVDDQEKVQLVLDECGDTPYQVKTVRGVHLGYRKRKNAQMENKVNLKGLAIDVRTDGGVCLIPPSATTDAYRWMDGCGLRPVSELPVARIGWTRERRRKQAKSVLAPEPAERDEILYRGRLYVDRFERAVSGQNGHTKLFVAAMKIVRFVRMLQGSEEQMWNLLLYFNATKCDPPWDPSDPRDLAALDHKLSEALKK